MSASQGNDRRGDRPSSSHRVRVGYGDTDQGGVAHHSTYIRWLEQARVEFLRERGLVYRDLEYDRKYALPVIEAHLQYRRPARFDDELDVETWVGKLGRASIRFDYRIVRADEVVCEAEIRLACVSLPELRPQSIPKDLHAILERSLSTLSTARG